MPALATISDSELAVPARVGTPAQARVDWLQYHLGRLPQLDMPLRHIFTPGLYAREIRMPANALVISRVHKTTHPYVVSAGRVTVWSEGGGVEHITAPHTGITTPGTRRLLFIHEDTIWTTFHPGPWTEETDLDQIVSDLTDTPDCTWIGRIEGQVRHFLEEQRMKEVA